MKQRTKQHLESFLGRYPALVYLAGEIEKTVAMLCEAQAAGGTILVCGNGGSAADAEHMAGELLKGFVLKRPIDDKLSDLIGDKHLAQNLQSGIRCIPLTSFPAFASAFANDCAPEVNFAQLVNTLGKSGDVLVAFSTSGNSQNVLYAATVARALGVRVVGLTGKNGGKLRGLCDVLLNAPSDVVYEVQEYHLPLYHVICLMVESELFEV